jgi:hypothetical protein
MIGIGNEAKTWEGDREDDKKKQVSERQRELVRPRHEIQDGNNTTTGMIEH